MLRKLMIRSLMVVTLASLPGCIIHDPGYYSDYRDYYYEPYYPSYPYYSGLYLYAPLWFSGYHYFGDYGRGHYYYGPRSYGRHGGGRGHR